jgi:hypothetical protein
VVLAARAALLARTAAAARLLAFWLQFKHALQAAEAFVA